MSTRRTCGDYRLWLKLLEFDKYRVSISRHGRRVTTFDVVPPVISSVALDHPTAFDQTARAAMSFFSIEESFDEAAAEIRDAGCVIRRGT